MRHSLVIVPPVINLRKTTIELLNEFLDKGGKVIGFKPIPERVNGEKGEEGLIRNLYRKIQLLPESGNRLISLVETLIQRDISITHVNKGTEIEDIYYQHRIVNNNTDIYFLVNNNRGKCWAANIKIPAKKNASLEIWDPVTGNISIPKEVSRKGGYLNASLYFPEAGSYTLIRREKRGLSLRARFLALLGTGCAISLTTRDKLCNIKKGNSNWACKQKGPNSITLDYCQYRTGRLRRWSPPTYVLDVQDILKKKLRDNTSFSIRYSFKTKLNKRPEPVFLVMEQPEQYEIKVNGRKVASKYTGYWIDIAFKKIDITEDVRLEGENSIELKSKFIHPTKPGTLIYVKGGTEIESVYLAGSFNVEGRFRPKKEGLIGQDFVIVDGKEPLSQETVTSGYPFYAGEFVFSNEFDMPFYIPKTEKVFLSLNKLDAITMKVTINKKEAGILLWPPYHLDITGLLQKGKNHIEIEITNSLRNLLGPHHQRIINPEGVGPDSFNDKKDWINGYTFMPFGIGKYAIKTYCL